MFRISHKAALAAILASCAPVIGGTGTATAATNADASAVTLVCDGVFRMQRASIEGTSEANFAGTMHVALVAEETEMFNNEEPKANENQEDEMVWLRSNQTNAFIFKILRHLLC